MLKSQFELYIRLYIPLFISGTEFWNSKITVYISISKHCLLVLGFLYPFKECYIYKDEVSPIAQNKQMSYCVLSTCVHGVCIILNLTTNYHANYNDRGLQNIASFSGFRMHIL